MFITTTIKLPKILEDILNDLLKIGVKPILVGGCIRDYFLKHPTKDYDIEIFGVDDLTIIYKTLQKFGKVKEVGKSFGVLILSTQNYDFDFTLARVEKKIGSNHKDYEIITNSKLTYKQAAQRRDFTINSIGYDYSTKKLLDPFGGLNDLKTKTLRHIDDKTFVEDALRVYRAAQFISRFNLCIDKATFFLCKKIVENGELEFLPKQRVYEEFKKLFLKSDKPSLAFEFLKDLGVIQKYFLELYMLIDCKQDKEYHPEGDVWTHTMMTLDEMSKIIKKEKIEDKKRQLILFYSILCHDLGKPFCTKQINGRVTSYKHESLGVEPTISFLAKLTDEKKLIQEICSIVQTHLRPFQLYLKNSSMKAIKRLSLKVNIENLCLVCLADCLGRDIKDKTKCYKASDWLLKKAKDLNIQSSAIKPNVMGRDLIDLGLKPSKKFKEILDFAFNLQLDKNLEKEQIIAKIEKKYL